jgi:hypothetical protein
MREHGIKLLQELHTDREFGWAGWLGLFSSSPTIETIPIKLDLSPVRVLQQVLAQGLISERRRRPRWRRRRRHSLLLHNGVGRVCLSYIA